MPGSVSSGDIQRNLTRVRERIAAACAAARRDPEGVRLIAVTKEQEPVVIRILMDAGIADFGENRIDHLESMIHSAPPGARFHAIGRLQSRQLAIYAGICSSVHSLCDQEHILKLEKACAGLGKRMPVFLQVNVAKDQAKAGLAIEEVASRLQLARSLPHLEVVGLMTIAAMIEDVGGQARAREAFSTLRLLAEQHGLHRLSMGMSADYVMAVEEGATDIRVGHELFI